MDRLNETTEQRVLGIITEQDVHTAIAITKSISDGQLFN